MSALSLLVAAVPFGFALLRAVRTGTDLRYLWMALSAFSGATIVMGIGRASSRGLSKALALSVVALGVAVLAAAWTASLLGTVAGPGMWVVASAFGLCSAMSHALRTLARVRQP
jgi:hypothetical protein